MRFNLDRIFEPKNQELHSLSYNELTRTRRRIAIGATAVTLTIAAAAGVAHERGEDDRSSLDFVSPPAMHDPIETYATPVIEDGTPAVLESDDGTLFIDRQHNNYDDGARIVGDIGQARDLLYTLNGNDILTAIGGSGEDVHFRIQNDEKPNTASITPETGVDVDSFLSGESVISPYTPEGAATPEPQSTRRGK